MDRSLSQVLRWGMAGWCLIGELGMFFSIYKLVLAGSGTYTLLDGRIPLLADPGLMTVVLAAVGVPLGYFIYQFYYFLFWTVPLGAAPPERALIERLIERCERNHQLDEVLQDLYGSWAEQVTASKFVGLIARPFTRRSGRSTRDVIRFRSTWALTRAAWLRSLSHGGDGNVGFALAGDRFEYLTSMYDGLGAVMVANWAALAVALSYKVWRITFMDGWLGSYTIELAHSPIRLPVVVVMGLFFALEMLLAKTLHRIVWTNRIYLRLSVVTLADSFICQIACDDPKCLEQDRAGASDAHDDGDDD